MEHLNPQNFAVYEKPTDVKFILGMLSRVCLFRIVVRSGVIPPKGVDTLEIGCTLERQRTRFTE